MYLLYVKCIDTSFYQKVPIIYIKSYNFINFILNFYKISLKKILSMHRGSALLCINVFAREMFRRSLYISLVESDTNWSPFPPHPWRLGQTCDKSISKLDKSTDREWWQIMKFIHETWHCISLGIKFKKGGCNRIYFKPHLYLDHGRIWHFLIVESTS